MVMKLLDKEHLSDNNLYLSIKQEPIQIIIKQQELKQKRLFKNNIYMIHQDYQEGVIIVKQYLECLMDNKLFVHQDQLNIEKVKQKIRIILDAYLVILINLFILKIPAHPDTFMIMEVQIPFSKRVEDSVGRTETYGWTQVDLFDHIVQKNIHVNYNTYLKRGKFKCPVYYGRTSPEQLWKRYKIQNLFQIVGSIIELDILMIKTMEKLKLFIQNKLT